MYTIVPFRRAFDSAFAPLFNDHFMREFFAASNAPEMRVDVREKEDAFLLEADLPGVKKEDISLDVNDGVLTISADINQEKKETKEGYVCNERRCGHVERCVCPRKRRRRRRMASRSPLVMRPTSSLTASKAE